MLCTCLMPPHTKLAAAMSGIAAAACTHLSFHLLQAVPNEMCTSLGVFQLTLEQACCELGLALRGGRKRCCLRLLFELDKGMRRKRKKEF